jgi:hypothetical protein
LLVVAHVESIRQIATNITLATCACVSRIFFNIL